MQDVAGSSDRRSPSLSPRKGNNHASSSAAATSAAAVTDDEAKGGTGAGARPAADSPPRPQRTAAAGSEVSPSWRRAIRTSAAETSRSKAGDGAEAVNANAETSVQRATVTIRYRADIQTTWRLTWANEIWKILSIDQVQHRNRWTEIVIERVKGTV